MLRTSAPFSFILFGASGHLAKIKIYPALYTLFLKGRLPAAFQIVGYARTTLNDVTFRELVAQSIRADFPEVNDGILEKFLSHVWYVAGQYDAADDVKRLATRVSELEQGQTSPVRLAYLSVPPEVFGPIVENVATSGLHRAPFRCLLEKPVGHDLLSAQHLMRTLAQRFAPDEVLLLDHYLGKEAVRNIHALRLANPILETVLAKAHAKRVEITALESDGIGNRAGFFESTGTFRDFVQSHLLMMGSLLTLDLSHDLVTARREALEAFHIPELPLQDIVRAGQYAAGQVHGKEVVGYHDEAGVAAGSRTNTFVALRLGTHTPRWEGVPFVLRTGKRLAQKETRVSIEFQPATTAPTAPPNRLDLILQGEAGMKLHLQTKLGGSGTAFRPLVLSDPLVCVGDCLPEHGLLLLEAIHGVRDWFLTPQEVETAWRLVDPVQAYLDHPDTPLFPYAAGTTGPSEAEAWMRAQDPSGWLA